ncbi:hypothetical protein [Schumannella sp. 10F1B-5-1]|uniref:hypothetical protein n=1 Tax=Schumannella sp. 10F1B-5-1 TaxID=2590780 RepID=UPI0011303288|nr:hypothetical protein [Schumannella sp. 10F1B-5-1]TPW78350.1 hypothetical protein FJ658_00640 [Schumannella sp. 10F1B-5-1]
MTTDRVADELAAFAVELANAGHADSIAVPGITADGERSDFTLVIGPASQLVVDDLTGPFALTAPEAEELLHERRIRSLRGPGSSGGSGATGGASA